MTEESTSPGQPRGVSKPVMRTAECKDCAREVKAGKREAGTEFFVYPEAWAAGQLDRGASRSDRCREHRQKHLKNIAGMAVAYIDLETVGEVIDPTNPAGPLGGLGPMPKAHEMLANEGVDLEKFGFGMDESHIKEMLNHLRDPKTRVLIVKAGTGTGKSTYMPYRFLDPPDGCFRLADLGPIIVTEPRVQATVGVAEFVGVAMSGAGGVGPGYPVGYQVSGDRQHDSACQLIYVTDGTMINWMREGRLSQIGTVIVDEAHERSINIDFILGYLKRELPRYPHLRVIVTSATFNEDFYVQYFGEDIAAKFVVPAVKTIGYGWPLFPDLDVPLASENHDGTLPERWSRLLPGLTLAAHLDDDAFVKRSWAREAPPLIEDDVADSTDVGFVEDLHSTTARLLRLRFQEPPIDTAQWRARMPETLGNFVVKLTRGLDRLGIYGDILSFLPTGKNIDEAYDIVCDGIGHSADVYKLIRTLPAEEKRAALERRRKGDRRKIVISTNLAETSLTVEGVRFVVDSGLIAQSEWDPAVAQGGIATKPHSQSGIKQRWGRVGRKAPGWVFPLYTKGQLIELAEDTEPGSTRDNLEQLIMTAKLGGIDDVVGFDWPAAFMPRSPVFLDEKALKARENFIEELKRADTALKKGGAVDPDGHPTSFGRELNRFSALGSASAAVAIMYADRLSCVPEVMTILALLYEKALTGTRGLLLDRADWPDEWRFEAAERHRALASACEDEAELVLQVCAGWERSDVTAPPWSSSGARGDWARRWWVNDEVLRAAAESRREVLTALSPAMKEEVKRFVEPALVRRARGVIARAMAGLEHRREGDLFRPITAPPNGEGLAVLESSCLAGTPSDRVIPLFRRNPTVDDFHRISNLVAVEPWATEGLGGDVVPTSPEDAMRLLTLSSAHARPDTSKDVLGATMESWPAGLRALMTFAPVDGRLRVTELRQLCPPFPAPRAEADSDPAEGIAPQGTDVSEVETAVEADAAPELDTAWPARNSAIPDDEVLAKRAVLDSREVEAAEAACGVCRWCLAGMPEECATPSTGEDGPTVDLLEAWRQRATLRVDVSTPLVDSGDGALSDGWYEVVGYRITLTGEPVVVLRHDWRPPGDPRGPAVHPDLRPGEPVELVVGPTVRDHRDELLMFERADGLGRFLLREAPTSARRQDENGQIAVSLHRQYQGLLARLKLHKGATVVATAIPRKETGCYTVTFLDLLRQHLDASSEGHVEKFEVETKKGRMAVPFYPAVVTREANSRGYVEAQLLARDSTIGLVHGASFLTGESVGVEEPDKGTGILLRLSPATAVLSLRGVPLDPIRPIVDREPSLDLPLPDTDPYEEPDETTLEDAESSEAGLLALDKDEENTVGGVTSVLFARRPVPKYVARELCTVADAPAWSSSVWRFWAQSRHLNTNRAEPYRTGAPATDSIEFSAELREEASPPPRLSLEEAQERYPVGTTVDATVTGIGNGGARAWLRLPDGTKGTIVKGAAGSRGIADLREVLAVEAVVSAQVREVNYFKDAIQVELTMRDLVVPGSGLSLEEAQECYPAGTTVDATVTGFTRAQDRVFLALEDGTEAMVLKGDVGRGLVVRLSAVLARGDRLSGVVKAVSEHEGKPQVRMRLPSVNAPPLAAQLQECGLSVGSEVPGTVKNVVEYGLFVQVAEGVDNGLVHVSTLPGRSVLGFDVGTVVRVEILSAAENPKRAGAISLGLRYIGRV